MIFLTLGTQLPFDRLAKVVDEVAATIDEPVFGQIGTTTYRPKNFEFVDTLLPTEFSKRFSSSRLIIAHAGIGTILTAKKNGKPIAVMARKSSLGEHRNDHQTATCVQMEKTAGIYIFEDPKRLRSLVLREQLVPMNKTEVSQEKMKLIDSLRVHISNCVG